MRHNGAGMPAHTSMSCMTAARKHWIAGHAAGAQVGHCCGAQALNSRICRRRASVEQPDMPPVRKSDIDGGAQVPNIYEVERGTD